jgi:DNA mismatch repair protein MutL
MVNWGSAPQVKFPPADYRCIVRLIVVFHVQIKKEYVTDIIQLLPDSVANQIAAGEVIQRPASVVKELVENAIDAGAEKIQVHIKDAGRTLIQVTDNGKGMSPTDARMAFERHATSKIRQANDLFRIKTMGFRGEALASIASVADVLLKTKRADDEVGTSIHLSGSEVIAQEPLSCSNGSTLMVRNLFFNVPARRKFLKSNTIEFKHIINEIQRVALAHPAIAFSLHHNETLVYDIPSANHRKRIVHLFGNNMNQNLLPIHSDTSMASISGFIGQPKSARKSFGEQFFFVNNRFMKHPYFHRAVLQAFDKLIQGDAIPTYFIYFNVDPENIDINIHPTKTEIKFESENAIWQLLLAAVREGLGKFNVVPSIDFDQSGSIDIPIAPKSTDGLYRPEIQTDPNFNPFQEKPTNRTAHGHFEKNNQDRNWEKLYEVFNNDSKKEDFQIVIPNEQEQQTQINPFHNDVPAFNFRNMILLKGKYLLTPVKSGLMVIDQRRAHQRILYEQFLKMMDSHMGLCQQLLFPQTLELQPVDSAMIQMILPELNEMGFDLREFGPNTYIISGMPAFLNEMDAKAIIELFLEEYKNSGTDLKERARERLAESLAIASAIGYGHNLNHDEAGELIDNLFACNTPNYSPTGKPVLEIIPMEEIEKKMK